jgi:hypothetical protein
MASADLTFQEVVKAELDAALPAVPHGAYPPGGQALPYIEFGRSDVADHVAGHVVTMTVHVWSSVRGPHEVKAHQETIRGRLHQNDFTRNGWTFVNVREDYCTVLLDPDGVTWHGVQRFRTLASQ